jgi:16S rRNA (guanine527-N7)-methyltransferase
LTVTDLPPEDLPRPESLDLPGTLERYHIALPADQVAVLDRYCQLLWAWNQKLNLTRHTDYEKFVTRDLQDTLQLATLLQPNEEVLDLGSGGGVPGIVLAILRPDLQVVLCDSVQKKAVVLRDLIQQLDLPVAVHHERGEALLTELRFHSLVARAVGPLDKMLIWLADSWLGFDRLLAIKGPRWKEEKDEAARRGLLRGLEVECRLRYPMLGTESESVILEVRRA